MERTTRETIHDQILTVMRRLVALVEFAEWDDLCEEVRPRVRQKKAAAAVAAAVNGARPTFCRLRISRYGWSS